MDKEKLSFADMERLLGALAEQDRAAVEHMRDAARGEIRRCFRRRRCLRVAGWLALLSLLALPLALLPGGQRTPAPAVAAVPRAPGPPEGFCADARLGYDGKQDVRYGVSCHGGYDIEVCAVPL